jgi:hypothetical protein
VDLQKKLDKESVSGNTKIFNKWSSCKKLYKESARICTVQRESST